MTESSDVQLQQSMENWETEGGALFYRTGAINIKHRSEKTTTNLSQSEEKGNEGKPEYQNDDNIKYWFFFDYLVADMLYLLDILLFKYRVMYMEKGFWVKVGSGLINLNYL